MNKCGHNNVTFTLSDFNGINLCNLFARHWYSDDINWGHLLRKYEKGHVIELNTFIWSLLVKLLREASGHSIWHLSQAHCPSEVSLYPTFKMTVCWSCCLQTMTFVCFKQLSNYFNVFNCLAMLCSMWQTDISMPCYILHRQARYIVYRCKESKSLFMWRAWYFSCDK